jgi:hypothetical protein
MFAAAKDALTSQVARRYVNSLIGRYGVVRELKIDSAAKSAGITCELIGEAEPVIVRVEHYRIIDEAGKRWIEVTACSCSRPWLQHLLEDHACGRRVELPGWAAAAL